METEEIKYKLNELMLEHRDLDDAISLMSERPFIDELQMRRMKARKLKLKDQILLLESKLIPDIEA
ncbi:MAG: DUF465 domain-containing protein [Gammaproteobacteria bacterium]|nr:DUF465 domain-containing protein [Gammaproteobacteria bacterium]MCW8986741.1 DUF465 domain-containing protein [Gammaproteobacteria bacterium]MCW9031583.1 DUF465 domain-containing protein [Gammaproteobacteria bacterium]